MLDRFPIGTIEQELKLDGKIMRYAAATGARGYPVYGSIYRLKYVGEGAISGSLYDIYNPDTDELILRDEPGYRFEPTLH